MSLGLTGQEERGECLGSPGRAGLGMGCPQGLQPLWAQQGACGQGTRDLPLLLPSPPACLPPADPDQTLEGRELRRGSSQGPVARMQHHWARKSRGGPGQRTGKMQSNPLIGPVSLPTACVLVPHPAARSPDNSVPSRPSQALGPTAGRAPAGAMGAGFGEPGRAGGALRGRFQVAWRLVNRAVGRGGRWEEEGSDVGVLTWTHAQHRPNMRHSTVLLFLY